MRRPIATLALLAAVSLTAASAARGQDAKPRILQIDLPGELVMGAVTRGPAPSLWLATREDDAETLAIHRFDTGGSPALALRSIEATADVEVLAGADFDGDGQDELVLLAPGRWTRVRDPRSKEPTVFHEGEGRWVRPPSGGRITAPSTTPPAFSRVGGFVRLQLTDDQVRPSAEVELPVQAEARTWGLRLSSPPPVPVPGGGWIAWEEPRDRQLTATWIPSEGEAVTLQLLLPEPEQIESVHPLSLNGSPYLFVAGFVSMGPMANQRVGLFPLRGTEGPVEPVMVRELDVHVWHTIEAFGADVDGDGRDELVLGAPEGMGGGDLRLLSFDVSESGAVEPRPKVTKLDLHEASWTFGPDLDGDARPDLLLVSGGRLTLYSGPRPGASLPRSLGTDVSQLLEAPEEAPETTTGGDADDEASRPGPIRHQVVDVDGDGIAEVLVWRTTGDATRLVLARLVNARGHATGN